MEMLDMSGSPTELLGRPWTRQSEDVYIHRTGARIERRGFPAEAGWYLVSPQRGQTHQRFLPTTQGCDDAFIAFSAKYAH